VPSVKVKDTDSFEVALKNFKKKCEREGILSEIKKREHYDKPSVKKKKKIIAARKKAAKRRSFSAR
jgi:small subunit ribosomal protein S21